MDSQPSAILTFALQPPIHDSQSGPNEQSTPVSQQLANIATTNPIPDISVRSTVPVRSSPHQLPSCGMVTWEDYTTPENTTLEENDSQKENALGTSSAFVDQPTATPPADPSPHPSPDNDSRAQQSAPTSPAQLVPTASITLISSSSHAYRRRDPVERPSGAPQSRLRTPQEGEDHEQRGVQHHPMSSSDSFDGHTRSQDGNAYLSTTAAFNTRLMDLGDDVDPQPPAQQSQASTEAGRYQTAVEDDDDDDDYYGLPPPNQYRPPLGSILVSKTPSTNSFTQSTDNSLPESQPAGFREQTGAAETTRDIPEDYVWQATQVDEDMDLHYEPVATQPLTQPLTQQLTQPSTQPLTQEARQATRSPSPPHVPRPGGLIPSHVKDRYMNQGLMNSAGRVLDPDVNRVLIAKRNPFPNTDTRSRRVGDVEHQEDEDDLMIGTQVSSFVDKSLPSLENSLKRLSYREETPPRQMRSKHLGTDPELAERSTRFPSLHKATATRKPEPEFRVPNVIPPSEPDATVHVRPASLAEDHLADRKRTDKGKAKALPEIEDSGIVSDDGDCPVSTREIEAHRHSTPPRKDISRARSKKRKLGTVDADSRRSKRTRTISRGPSQETHDMKPYGGGTRIFALWKPNDGFYYVASLISRVTASKFEVLFEDGFSEVVDLSRMRQCILQPGDRIATTHVKATRHGLAVTSVSRWADEGFVEVDNDGENVEVDASEVRIKSTWVGASWNNRTLTGDEVVFSDATVDGPESPSKATRASTSRLLPVSRQGKGGLHGTGFVISLPPNISEPEARKEQLAASIVSHGGVVFEDWTDLYSMDGVVSHGDKRWVCKSTDIQYIGPRLDRMFLLAEQETFKPKYLFALACGIPCISTAFVEEFKAEAFANWRNQLLPAGHSIINEERISQRILYDWDTLPNQMTDLPTRGSRYKVFANCFVLFVGEQFIPSKPRRRGVSDRKQEPYTFIPKIALAMGAKQAEAVSEIGQASLPLVEYHRVILPDDTAAPWELKHQHVRCLNIAWIKEFLVSGLESLDVLN